MKYCPKCNSEVPDSATQCDRCQSALNQVTATSSKRVGHLDLANADEAQLMTMLHGLEGDVKTQESRISRLRILGVALAVLFVALLVTIHFIRVMRYATMKSVSIVEGEGKAGVALITYRPSSEGRVDFTRVCGAKREELAEYIAPPLEREFNFQWGGESEGGYTVCVIYRSGLFLKKEKKYFED